MRNAARVFAAIKDADLLKLPFRRVPFGRRLWNARSTPTERSGGSSLVGGLAAPRPAQYPTPLAGPSFVRASARARRRSGKPRHSFESYVNVMGFGVCGCLWATAYHLPASKSAMSSEDELSSLSAELNGVSGEVQATQEELDQLPLERAPRPHQFVAVVPAALGANGFGDLTVLHQAHWHRAVIGQTKAVVFALRASDLGALPVVGFCRVHTGRP